MTGTNTAHWVGGPHDGEEVGIPAGCRELHSVTSLYACDEDMCITETRTTIPIEMGPDGVLRIMFYKATREED